MGIRQGSETLDSQSYIVAIDYLRFWRANDKQLEFEKWVVKRSLTFQVLKAVACVSLMYVGLRDVALGIGFLALKRQPPLH